MKKILFSLIVICCLSSCRSVEQRYVDNYSRFAEKFLTECNDYTQKDWEAAAVKYEEFREQYSTHMANLTPEQRRNIETYNSKINAEFIKHEVNVGTEQLRSIINEAVGTLNELLQ